MKVKELIKLLKQVDQNAQVTIWARHKNTRLEFIIDEECPIGEDGSVKTVTLFTDKNEYNHDKITSKNEAETPAYFID